MKRLRDSTLAGLRVSALLLVVGCETGTELIDADEPTRLLLEEDFTTNGGNWFIGTREGSYRIEMLDGQYRLQSWNDTGVFSTKPMPLPEAGSFDIRVDLKLREAGDDRGYGICWGGKDADSRACFFLSADSQFTVFDRVDGAVRERHPWTRSPRIRPDGNALEIRRRGKSMAFRINGAEVARLAAGPQAGNQLGFAGDGRVDFGVDRIVARVE